MVLTLLILKLPIILICLLLQKAAQDFSVVGASTQSARLHFAHSETIYLLLCLLDLGDQSTSKEQMDKSPPFHLISSDIKVRFWKSAKITPMAGNFLATLYSCNGDFKVRFAWNEQVVSAGWCDGLECNLEDLIERIQSTSL